MALGVNFSVQVIGVDHEVADVAQRERCAFGVDEIFPAVKAGLKVDGVRELAILSTCNRVEVVAVLDCERTAEGRDILVSFLREQKGLDTLPDIFHYCDGAAVEHLCRVAAGMESMVLGEYQILAQVKESLDSSRQAGGVDTILNGLFVRAITASKRVRSDTQLGAGSVSVAGSAVDLIKKFFKDLRKHRALIIGAGETGELVAKHLAETGVQKIVIANRSIERARVLAAAVGAEVVALENLSTVLRDVDIVFGTTASPQPILSVASLKAALVGRPMRPLALIDLAVPRDFEAGVDNEEFVFLHTLDDLQKLIDYTIDVRRRELGAAGEIVAHEVIQFEKWCRGLDVAPTIVELRSRVMEIQNAELDRQKKRLSPKELDSCVNFSTAVLNKLLHLPTSQLKQCDINDNDDLRRLNHIRDCFGLDL